MLKSLYMNCSMQRTVDFRCAKFRQSTLCIQTCESSSLKNSQIRSGGLLPCYFADMMPHDSSETNPADLTLIGAIEALRSGSLTAVELLDAMLERTRECNGGEPSFDGALDSINAWARIYPERARFQAKQADDQLQNNPGNAPLLCGIPWGAKDLFAVKDLPLTASSRVLADHVAQESAAIVEHLESQGMVLIGHTHTHEFAAGGSTDQVGNPWALDRSAGGSSGGAAAALATGMIPAAIGTDTAGSVRIPASLCGVSAIKPSFNRVPAAGIIPLSPTLDHVGSMARTVADAAVLLSVMSRSPRPALPWMGWGDPHIDISTTVPQGDLPLAGTRIAVTERNASELIHDDIAAADQAAREAAQRLGAEIVELTSPMQMSRIDYDTVLIAEARSYHRRHATSKDLYRGSTRDFLDFEAEEIPVSKYLAAQQRRLELTERWRQWFDYHGIDAILEPTQAIPAPKRGHGYDPNQAVGGEDPMTYFTALWNFTGFPAVTLPTIRGPRTGLPMSASLISAPGRELRAVRIGLALQHYEFPVPTPPIVAGRSN